MASSTFLALLASVAFTALIIVIVTLKRALAVLLLSYWAALEGGPWLEVTLGKAVLSGSTKWLVFLGIMFVVAVAVMCLRDEVLWRLDGMRQWFNREYQCRSYTQPVRAWAVRLTEIALIGGVTGFAGVQAYVATVAAVNETIGMRLLPVASNAWLQLVEQPGNTLPAFIMLGMIAFYWYKNGDYDHVEAPDAF